MSDAGFASLGPTLLARKGGAKPAMRPQLAPLPETQVAEEALEDLGWNDMGGDEDDSDNGNVVKLNPSSGEAQPESPVVKRQQKDLADRVLADAVMEGPVSYSDEEDFEDEIDEAEEAEAPSPVLSKPKKQAKKVTTSASDKGRRAAFTLRLDTDRHLKLRLAATMRGISAQALVTEALDEMLDQIEDLGALAERMKRN